MNHVKRPSTRTVAFAAAAAAAATLGLLTATCCGGLALADAPAVDAALAYINANAVTASSSVECRFILEYAPSDAAAAESGRSDRAATFSGSLTDGVLALADDRHTLSGLGLAFDYDLMTDNGHGRMARASGSSQAESAIALQDIVPASLRIADLTPPDQSATLDWLRHALPPPSFAALDRITVEYQAQGWNPHQSAGTCPLGKAHILEIRWTTRHGESLTANVLWPLGLAEFKGALKTLLGSGRKQQH